MRASIRLSDVNKKQRKEKRIVFLPFPSNQSNGYNVNFILFSFSHSNQQHKKFNERSNNSVKFIPETEKIDLKMWWHFVEII